jgi:NAD(P)-dependent dehydrogenase (short-subunit alcohol dehydrogenase family)
MPKLQFDGDVVVVTGAGGGMGRAHALELARRGARVVVNDLGGHPFGGGSDASLAESVVAEIRAFGGEAVANTQSVATAAGGASLTETAIRQWGRIDAIVANAAILRDVPVEDMTAKDFDDVHEVNLRGAFFCVQPAYRAMKANGGGRILAATSAAGLLGNERQANYAASKGGLLGFIRSVAVEGAPHGIKANLLAPGALGTRMHRAMLAALSTEPEGTAAESAQQLTDPSRFDRLTPDRVSPMVTVLTHESCPCTGQVLSARGGMFQLVAVTFNDGWVADEMPTAEDIRDHWAEIIDPRSAEDPGPDAYAYATRSYDRLVGSRVGH